MQLSHSYSLNPDGDFSFSFFPPTPFSFTWRGVQTVVWDFKLPWIFPPLSA